MTDDRTSDAWRAHFQQLGRKGGKAYAKKVPKSVRKSIAKLGGQASVRALRARLEKKGDAK